MLRHRGQDVTSELAHFSFHKSLAAPDKGGAKKEAAQFAE